MGNPAGPAVVTVFLGHGTGSKGTHTRADNALQEQQMPYDECGLDVAIATMFSRHSLNHEYILPLQNNGSFAAATNYSHYDKGTRLCRHSRPLHFNSDEHRQLRRARDILCLYAVAERQLSVKGTVPFPRQCAHH